MVTVNHQGIILHIIIVLHQRCLNCSECFQRHSMFYTCNYNIRVTHRNGTYMFFTRIRSTEGSSADCSLFILSLHALALHLAVKILLQIFCMKIWASLWPYISTCRLYFPPECQQDRTLLLRNQYYWAENIPNIWHKSSTKHKGRDQIETIKTIMQTTRLVSHGRFYQWLRLPFLKKYSIKCERFRLWIVYSELKRHNVSHYIYYLATDNIHIVLENDNTVLIKRT